MLAVVLSLASALGGLKAADYASPRASVVGGLQPAEQGKETIVSIIVHGNQIVTDEEVIKLSGLKIGTPFTSTTLADVKTRLKDSGKFETIDVVKGYASIDDLTKVIVVIDASEGPVRIADPLTRGIGGSGPRIVKRHFWNSLMFMPIFDAEDGYGMTFGARVALPKLLGPRSRLSFPLTWGGTRRAGAELERSFTSGPISRVEFGGAIQQRRNPAYETNDRRNRAWARAEKRFGPLRAGGTVGWQRVTFGETREDSRTVGVDVVFDTRLDPVLPRNAVYVTASLERVFFQPLRSGGPVIQIVREPINRTRVDARGFIGTFGQQVLVVRALREDANSPQPLYFRSLLGGWSNLRGFEAGFKTGDTLVAASLEYRIPISSPLSFGKLGVSVFADWGTAYEKGQRLRDQTLDRGVGASVWIALTGFRISLGLAHGKGAGPRVSFGGGLTF